MTCRECHINHANKVKDNVMKAVKNAMEKNSVSETKIINVMNGIQCKDTNRVLEFLLLSRHKSIMDTNKNS